MINLERDLDRVITESTDRQGELQPVQAKKITIKLQRNAIKHSSKTHQFSKPIRASMKISKPVKNKKPWETPLKAED